MGRVKILGVGLPLMLAMAFVTVVLISFPRAVTAQALRCCCETDISQCVDAPENEGYQCPPDGSPQLVTPVTELDIPSCQGVTQCADLANCTIGAAAPPPSARVTEQSSWLKPILGDELIPKECREGDAKGCTLNHLLQVLVNITKVMLAVLGSAAFAMFTYGGLVFLTSAGNQERVTAGRKILTNAVLGILVVLVSWTAVNFVVVALSQGRSGFGEVGRIFTKEWNRGP